MGMTVHLIIYYDRVDQIDWYTVNLEKHDKIIFNYKCLGSASATDDYFYCWYIVLFLQLLHWMFMSIKCFFLTIYLIDQSIIKIVLYWFLVD